MWGGLAGQRGWWGRLIGSGALGGFRCGCCALIFGFIWLSGFVLVLVLVLILVLVLVLVLGLGLGLALMFCSGSDFCTAAVFVPGFEFVPLLSEIPECPLWSKVADLLT